MDNFEITSITSGVQVWISSYRIFKILILLLVINICLFLQWDSFKTHLWSPSSKYLILLQLNWSRFLQKFISEFLHNRTQYSFFSSRYIPKVTFMSWSRSDSHLNSKMHWPSFIIIYVMFNSLQRFLIS